MKNRKNRIFLMLLILLLTFSFVSTPITALASSKDNRTKEPPITTSGEDFYIEEEIPTEEWFGEDSAAYEYIFCGIPDLAHAGHDHSSVLFDTHDKVIDAYQNSLDIDVQVYDTELSTSSCLQYLKDAAVFTSRGHGGFHPNSDGSVKCTLIILGTASVMYSHTHTSSTQDQYIISSSDDFSQLDLAVFAGCNTGAGGVGANNLPTKAVECGARVAIGFEGSIGCDAANTWTRVFYESLLAGKTVNVAVANANRESGLVTTVCGDGTYCLP